MSNMIDLNELKKQMAEQLTSDEWKVFSQKLSKMLEESHKEITTLTLKNQQLEHLLKQKHTGIVPLSPEEIICLQQIRKLESISNSREMTLEEVKRLDLLVKNLKLIREESTIVVNNNNADIKVNDLVAIIKSDSSQS